MVLPVIAPLVVEGSDRTMSDWGPFSLQGTTAVVTGGSMGIGWAVTSRFSQAGANVVVADLDPDRAAARAKRLDAPGAIISVAADVTNDETPDAVVKTATDAFGGVDILVNNAGIYPVDPFLDTTREHFRRVLDINLVGLAFMSQAVSRHLVADGRPGRIINIASVSGMRPDMGMAAYDASKAGVIMLTKELALELAPHGINVTGIAPGFVGTEGSGAVAVDDADAAVDPASMQAIADDTLPLGRLGTPDDIATTAVFLASSAASYVTGTTIIVDGGRLLTGD